MKKLLLIPFFCCLVFVTHAQQFSFQMFFSDAVGNKDTITLGYDPQATNGIDNLFGETNIISVPTNTLLDVRVTDIQKNQPFPGTFDTKKQIVNYTCTPLEPINSHGIGIRTKHWPVTASWNNTLFNDNCRIQSVFTSINPGGWWDTGSPSDLNNRHLFSTNSATFTSNVPSGFFNPAYSYIKAGDTIPVFWIAFGNNVIINNTDEFSGREEQIKIFPNPAKDKISVQFLSQSENIDFFEIYSTVGQLLLTSRETSDMDISELSKGLYLVVATNDSGKQFTARIVKE